MKFPFLAAFFTALFGEGKSEIKVDEKTGAVTMSKEMFEATEKLAGEVATLKSEVTTLKTEKKNAEDKTAASETSLAAIRTEIGVDANADDAVIKTKITELKQLPGKAATTTQTTEEKVTVESTVTAEMQKKIDEMPHNKTADEMSFGK